MAIVVTALLTAALVEIRSARGGDVVNPDDLDYANLVFNELVDAWNIDPRATFAKSPTLPFTLTPNLQPHTIGLAANSPTFAVLVARPTEILAANLVLTGNIRAPLALRDDDWWMAVRARGVTAAVPTDLYYEADWPNGSINLWPVPTAPYGLELETRTLLTGYALTDSFDCPPGYQQAVRLTLAELLAPGFGQDVSASTATNARLARAAIFGANDVIPNLCTRDAGVPGRRSGSAYNYRTG